MIPSPTEHNSELREKLEAELWKLSDYRPGESWGEDDYISRAANAVLALIEEHDRQVLRKIVAIRAGETASNDVIAQHATDMLAALEQGDK